MMFSLENNEIIFKTVVCCRRDLSCMFYSVQKKGRSCIVDMVMNRLN